MLKLKGKDTPIMVIPSDSSRGNSPWCSARDIYARCLSLFDTKPTLMQNKERHMSFLQSPSLISSKKTNARPSLHFKDIKDPSDNL